jgi:RsiW-degrading membrane proteinase PrsW (M82 family)
MEDVKMVIEDFFVGMMLSFSLAPFYYIFVEIIDSLYRAFREELSDE